MTTPEEKYPLHHDRFDAITRVVGTRFPRRTAFALTIAGFLGAPGPAAVKARKKKKNAKSKGKKKPCQKGKQRCGQSCCGTASACRAATCFCTGHESPRGAGCVDVATILIRIIANETGVPAEQIGANPQQPLEDLVVIDEGRLLEIDKQIKETFQVEGPVPYYTQGIAAGAASIEREIVAKA
jgi:hypothetical protein